MVLSLHSAKNPDDAELEDTLQSVVSNVYCVLCVFKLLDTEIMWMLVQKLFFHDVKWNVIYWSIENLWIILFEVT